MLHIFYTARMVPLRARSKGLDRGRARRVVRTAAAAVALIDVAVVAAAAADNEDRSSVGYAR